MKIIQQLLVIIVSCLILLSVEISCSTAEKTAVRCPEFSGKRYDQHRHGVSRNPKHSHANKHSGRKGINNLAQGDSPDRRFSPLEDRGGEYPVPTILSIADKMQDEETEKLLYLSSLTASLDDHSMIAGINNPAHTGRLTTDKCNEAGFVWQPVACDTIVLKAGDIIFGKVIEIGLEEVKYRNCANPDGPAISIRKSDVFVIKYPNGNRDFITTANTPSSPGNADIRKNEGMGIAGFVASLVGLFVFGIPLGLLAVIFGAVSLGKIKKHPGKYRGKGLAIASLVIGMVDIIGVIIVLSLQ